MFKKIKIVCLGSIYLLVLILSACVTTSEMYKGNIVSPEQVVAIEDRGPHKDILQTFDIQISYEFVREGDVMEITGQAALADRYPGLYGSLKYLHLYLFFLDEDSRVLETVSLANSLTSSLGERLGFSRSINVPTGALGISFGYDGEVVEGGDGGKIGGGRSTSYTFYRLPLQK